MIRIGAAGGLGMIGNVLLNKSLLLLQRLLIHLVQHVAAQLDVGNEHVALGAGKVLANHDAQHLEVICVRRHCVRRHDPAAAAQAPGQGELVILALTPFPIVVLLGVWEAEGDERKALAGAAGHDDESLLLERGAEVVGSAGDVAHDGAVAAAAEADELVVLADDLGGAFGEVEGEGGLVGAEVVDVEDEVLWKVFGGSPDDPANAGVDKAVLTGISVCLSERIQVCLR